MNKLHDSHGSWTATGFFKWEYFKCLERLLWSVWKLQHLLWTREFKTQWIQESHQFPRFQASIIILKFSGEVLKHYRVGYLASTLLQEYLRAKACHSSSQIPENKTKSYTSITPGTIQSRKHLGHISPLRSLVNERSSAIKTYSDSSHNWGFTVETIMVTLSILCAKGNV